MKLIDIAKKIDKSKSNESCVDITDFNYEFNYEFDYIEQDRLKAYWIGNWYCTDSYVGYRIYFLDNKPVAFSIQSGRKSDEIFKWFSKELAIKVKDYLVSIMPKNDELNVSICDINEDIGNSYKINYNNQIINYDNATLNGESVQILDRIKEIPDWGIDTQLKIKISNGEIKIVNVYDLDFKFNLV